jgi:hypothetical protein
MIEPAHCLRTAAFPLVSVILELNPREALCVIAKAIKFGLDKAAFAELRQRLVFHENSSFLRLIWAKMKWIATLAVQCNLEASTVFILAYVSPETVSWFADAFIDNCTQRNPDFFEVVVHIIRVCSEENLSPVHFFETVFPLLEEIVENAVVLSPDHPSFRSFSSKFYAGVYRAFIYAAHIVCPDFECEQYFAFFVTELTRNKEKWRLEASLRGLTEIVGRFSDRISMAFIELALSVVLALFPQMKNLIEADVALLCRAVAAIDSLPQSVMDLLLFATVKIVCDCQVLIKIVDVSGVDLLRMLSSDLLSTILGFPEIESLRTLAAKVPEICQKVPQTIPDDNEFKSGMFEVCIENRQCWDWCEIEAFGWAHFHPFGVRLAQAALRAGVIEPLPKLMNTALHLFLQDEIPVIELLDLWAQNYGGTDAVAEALLKACAVELKSGKKVDNSGRLLNAVKKANPGQFTEFAKEPSIRDLIVGVEDSSLELI